MSTRQPDPADEFLIALWDHLDAASSIAVDADVLSRLTEIKIHCQAVVDLIGEREGAE